VTSKPSFPAQSAKKDSVVDMRIDDLAYGGKSIGRIENLVIFVSHGVPGDRVRARITKRKKTFAEAEIEEILEPSPDRIDAPCPLFGECGGCSWQNVPYAIQLEHKQRQAESLLERLGKARPERIEPIIASPRQWRYRNKTDFTFGSGADGRPIIGFHRPRRFADIIEVPACLLQPEPVDRLLGTMTEWVRQQGLMAYNPHGHGGFLRHFVVRHSVKTNEVLAVLLTSQGDLPDPEGLVASLREACPELKGFVWGTNVGVADVARQDTERWRWGKNYIEEELGGLRFRVSPLSFFQVNTPAAELLYAVIRGMLGDEAREMRLLDAYCGTGSIGLFCAERVGEIVGIEVLREAIWDARANARANGIGKCLFLAGEMRDALPLAAETGSFGRLVMDPPRGGMDKRSLRGLLELRSPVMIYVSCNPSTLARDLVTITEAGYRPTVMQPVDLFPQTFHIEAVVRFELQNPPPPATPRENSKKR